MDLVDARDLTCMVVAVGSSGACDRVPWGNAGAGRRQGSSATALTAARLHQQHTGTLRHTHRTTHMLHTLITLEPGPIRGVSASHAAAVPK